METVFRSSFLLVLTCSKRICFPSDTDLFLCVKEWGWSIWGPVPGGAGSPRIREAGALGGGTPPPVRTAAGPFGACGAKASAPGCVYQPTFVSGRPGPRFYRSPFFSCLRISVESRFRLFHINEEGLYTAPLFCALNGKIKKASFAYHRSGCIFFMQAVQIPRELPHSRPGRKADAR